MEFKLTFFAIVLFSMVIIAFGIIVNEQVTKYNPEVSSDLENLNKMESLMSTAESQKGNINPQSGEASSDYEAETFRGGYGIITSIYSPFRVVFGDNGMIDDITERYGFPDYVRKSLVIMFIFAVTFGIIAIVFRLGRTAA